MGRKIARSCRDLAHWFEGVKVREVGSGNMLRSARSRPDYIHGMRPISTAASIDRSAPRIIRKNLRDLFRYAAQAEPRKRDMR